MSESQILTMFAEDADLASVTDDLVGKTLIIGLTYLHADGSLDHQAQLHGVIEAVSSEGISVRLGDGRLWNLPPAPDALQKAPPGEYRFRATGEVIVNPDFMTTWTITEPQVH